MENGINRLILQDKPVNILLAIDNIEKAIHIHNHQGGGHHIFPCNKPAVRDGKIRFDKILEGWKSQICGANRSG